MLRISANALQTIRKTNNTKRSFKCQGMKFFKEDTTEEIETGEREFTLSY